MNIIDSGSKKNNNVQIKFSNHSNKKPYTSSSLIKKEINRPIIGTVRTPSNLNSNYTKIKIDNINTNKTSNIGEINHYIADFNRVSDNINKYIKNDKSSHINNLNKYLQTDNSSNNNNLNKYLKKNKSYGNINLSKYIKTDKSYDINNSNKYLNKY